MFKKDDLFSQGVQCNTPVFPGAILLTHLQALSVTRIKLTAMGISTKYLHSNVNITQIMGITQRDHNSYSGFLVEDKQRGYPRTTRIHVNHIE